MKRSMPMIVAVMMFASTADAAANSCIVSGITERTSVIACTAVAINSDLDTRPAPEVRLDGLNLRTDEVHGFVLLVK